MRHGFTRFAAVALLALLPGFVMHAVASDDALAHWTQALATAESAQDTPAQARALLGLGQAYLALGRAPLATARLQRAQTLAAAADGALAGEILAALGNAHALAGDFAAARVAQNAALERGRALRDANLTARSANDAGRLAALNDEPALAASLFREALAAAQSGPHAELAATAAVNLARVLRAGDDADAAKSALTQAATLARALPDSPARTQALVSVARLYAAPENRTPSAADLAQAQPLYRDATASARATGDPRGLSYALGYQSELQEAAGNLPAALTLARDAAQQAQLAAAPESLYRWEWQSARLLQKTGERDAALTAYQVAARTLERIRQDLTASGRKSFRQQAGPLYNEYADLLISRAQAATDANQAGADLREARRTVEALKGAELEDYFQDDCVAALKSKTAGIETLAPGTAAIYPVILPTRLAILVDLPEGLKVYSTPVAATVLEAEVRSLRRTLENRTTREYLAHARTVYDWLVRPLAADLARARIKTLVFVPDGVLRTIPLATLNDGKQHLIEQYAVATSPGLTLTDPRPLAGVAPRALISGLSDAVQGFSALPAVAEEIQAVNAVYGGTVLQNQQFQTGAFEQALTRQPYTIVHVASHGEFGPSADQTFLLTHDGRLTLDRLEARLGGIAYRDQPVELLTLSACQTAAGDDRTALGLAGVAVKAGVRSALATLWSVNDLAATRLVSDFYGQLGSAQNQAAGRNKAEALREAQLALLADKRYRHPLYWSAFLLIGNWL